MKAIFDLVIIPVSIVDNVFVDLILLSIVGFVSYKSAYFLVGQTEFRGGLGSLVHWIIRFIVYMLICYLIKISIKVYNFIILVPIQWYIAILLTIIMIFIIKHAINNKQSILNKKVF